MMNPTPSTQLENIAFGQCFPSLLPASSLLQNSQVRHFLKCLFVKSKLNVASRIVILRGGHILQTRLYHHTHSTLHTVVIAYIILHYLALVTCARFAPWKWHILSYPIIYLSYTILLYTYPTGSLKNNIILPTPGTSWRISYSKRIKDDEEPNYSKRKSSTR